MARSFAGASVSFFRTLSAWATIATTSATVSRPVSTYGSGPPAPRPHRGCPDHGHSARTPPAPQPGARRGGVQVVGEDAAQEEHLVRQQVDGSHSRPFLPSRQAEAAGRVPVYCASPPRGCKEGVTRPCGQKSGRRCHGLHPSVRQLLQRRNGCVVVYPRRHEWKRIRPGRETACLPPCDQLIDQSITDRPIDFQAAVA